jgi:hypothetical protein
MKTRLVVLLAAALALMIFVPTGANAVGVGKMCGGIGGIQCDAGQLCQKESRGMQHPRHVRHLRENSAVLSKAYSAGLRLRWQDVQQ